MRVLPLGSGDEALLRRVHAVRVAVAAHDYPDLPEPPYADFVGGMRHPAPDQREQHVAAVDDDGTPLGYGLLALPTLDNTATALMEVLVHPAHRRQGVGTALAEHLLAAGRAAGRSSAIAEACEPLAPGALAAGAAFAASFGFTRALEEIRRVLPLCTIDQDRLAALEADAGARGRAGGYSLRTWRDTTPDEHAVDVAVLEGRMTTDAPLGDLRWEPERWDPARLRQREARSLARGRSSFVAVARHDGSGRIVGYTALTLHRDDPQVVFQDDTIVAPDHRGHRLGTWIKAANLAQLLEAVPDTGAIHTWNAGSNRHMIDVNDALGFVPVDRWAEWQRDL